MINNFKDGNKVKLLTNGINSYSKRWEILENAKSRIYLSTFSFMKDNTTKKLVETLIKKLQEGIEVKIIYDDIVNRTTFVGPLLKKLVEAGAETCNYNYLWEGLIPKRNNGNFYKQLSLIAKLKLKQHYHEKYLIVDSKYLILGGINWGDKYAYGGIKEEAWRDTDVYIEGPVVSDVQLQFLFDFEKYSKWKEVKTKYSNKYYKYILENEFNIDEVKQKYGNTFGLIENAGDIRVSYIGHKPYDEISLPLTNVFLKYIKEAKKRIYWGCHGIRPPKIYLEYFIDAVNRGVEVVLITNSKYSAKTLMIRGLLGWMYLECSKHYKDLLKNNIRIFEWTKKGAYHSKTLLIDDDFVSIGSYNIARGSAFHHSESNVIIQDAKFNSIVFNQFLEDLKFCNELKLNDLKIKLPNKNAYDRIIHERNKLVDKDLNPKIIETMITAKKYKKMFEKLIPNYYETR